MNRREIRDRFLFALEVNEELEFKIGPYYWYLGPSSANEGYENKKGWITYQFYSDNIIYIPSEDPEVIMNTKIQGKSLLDHINEFVENQWHLKKSLEKII